MKSSGLLGLGCAALLVSLGVIGVTGTTATGRPGVQSVSVAETRRPAPAGPSGSAATRAAVPVAQAVRAVPAPSVPGPLPAPPPTDLPATAGCLVPDPSTSGGCISPGMGVLLTQVFRTFGDLPMSCWDPRDGDPYSDHPKGKACDLTMGTIGRYAGPADVRTGWTIAEWLRVNHTVLHVNYVIWQGRIWSRAHDAEGWRVYTGGGHYSVSGPTNGHYDHVHVSTVD